MLTTFDYIGVSRFFFLSKGPGNILVLLSIKFVLKLFSPVELGKRMENVCTNAQRYGLIKFIKAEVFCFDMQNIVF